MALNLRIDLYADGADIRDMVAARDSELVKGFTTNPTLMRKSGITDYEKVAREALQTVSGMPISCEEFADEVEEMKRQTKYITTLGDGVIMKLQVISIAL